MIFELPGDERESEQRREHGPARLAIPLRLQVQAHRDLAGRNTTGSVVLIP